MLQCPKEEKCCDICANCRDADCPTSLDHWTVEWDLKVGREGSTQLHGLRPRGVRSVAEGAAGWCSRFTLLLAEGREKQENCLSVDKPAGSGKTKG